jgi:heat shock protein HslJ
VAPRRAPGLIPSLLTALVAGLAVVLSACADGSSAGASGGSAMSSGEPGGIPGGAAAQLAGRTFLSTSVTGHDLVDGSRIGITFRDGGTVEADAGCNSLSGPYRIEDGTLNASGLSQTEMGCDQDLMDQDTWFSGLLASGLAIDLNGDVLTLTGKEVTIQLTDRRVVDPDRPLEGTTWVLSGIVAGTGPDGTAASVPQGITATLRIADGKIHFFDGLNDSEGAITVAGETVHVDGDVATSAVGCATGSTCSVDMSLLTQDFTYRITAGQLTVTGTGKYTGHGLMFTAQDLSSTSSSTMPGGSMSGPTTTMAPASPDPGTGPSGSELPPPAGSIGGSDVPAPTAQPGPTAAPGTASELTSSVGPRTEVPGRHDSIPPQPSPGGTSDH